MAKPSELETYLSAGLARADRLVGTLAFTNVNAFGWAKQNALKLAACAGACGPEGA